MIYICKKKMSLETTINKAIKDAMLSRDHAKLDALRAVKSEILLAKTSKGGKKELSENDEITILRKLLKQRTESARIYQEQNRADLEEVELFQAKVIEAYLPQQLSNKEIVMKLKDIIERSGLSDPKDFGKIMGIASKEFAGRADNKSIAQELKRLLED